MAEDRYNAGELSHLVMNDTPIEPRCSNCVHWVNKACTANGMVRTEEMLDGNRIEPGAKFPHTKAYDHCAKFIFVVNLDDEQGKKFCNWLGVGSANYSAEREWAKSARWRISSYGHGDMQLKRDNQLTQEVIFIHDSRTVVYKQTAQLA